MDYSRYPKSRNDKIGPTPPPLYLARLINSLPRAGECSKKREKERKTIYAVGRKQDPKLRGPSLRGSTMCYGPLGGRCRYLARPPVKKKKVLTTPRFSETCGVMVEWVRSISSARGLRPSLQQKKRLQCLCRLVLSMPSLRTSV